MTRTSTLEQGGRAGGFARVALLVVAILLVVVSGLIMVSGPMLFRMGMIDLATALGPVQSTAMWTAAAAAGLGLVGLVLSFVGAKHRAGIVAVLVTALAGIMAGSLFGRNVSREDLPPIHDVQTDWSLPVAFTEATLKEREKAHAVRVRDDALIGENEGRWSGMSFAEAQSRFYVDIAPQMMTGSVTEVTAGAAKAAERMGWTVTRTDTEAGVVEAVYRSPWYELVHDVAVRVTPDGTGSRVDVRATSRMPGHDMGGNAALVKDMLGELLQVS
jgi:fatty-acyl-CoA synthase